MDKLTSLKDTDREILSHLPDRELLMVCTINKRMWNEVCDDNFLKRRLTRYPGISKFKKENESWKQFFLRVIYYVSKMQDEFNFVYSEGDFEKQYTLLKEAKDDNLLIRGSEDGELSIVKHALETGADIHTFADFPLIQAIKYNHMDVVKYLLSKGADIEARNHYPLIQAIDRNNFEIVKYLIEQGVDIHSNREYPITEASIVGNLDIVKYLAEHGADIHTEDDLPLNFARLRKHTDVVNYLSALNTP